MLTDYGADERQCDAIIRVLDGSSYLEAAEVTGYSAGWLSQLFNKVVRKVYWQDGVAVDFDLAGARHDREFLIFRLNHSRSYRHGNNQRRVPPKTQTSPQGLLHYQSPVEELVTNTRAVTKLYGMCVNVVGQLLQLNRETLQEQGLLSPRMIEDVETALAEHGLALSPHEGIGIPFSVQRVDQFAAYQQMSKTERQLDAMTTFLNGGDWMSAVAHAGDTRGEFRALFEKSMAICIAAHHLDIEVSQKAAQAHAETLIPLLPACILDAEHLTRSQLAFFSGEADGQSDISKLPIPRFLVSGLRENNICTARELAKVTAHDFMERKLGSTETWARLRGLLVVGGYIAAINAETANQETSI